MLARTNAQLPPDRRARSAPCGVSVRHVRPRRRVAAPAGGRPGVPLGDGPQLRTWAQDALETDDPEQPSPDDLTREQQVARAVLDFLRARAGRRRSRRSARGSTPPTRSAQSTQGVELLTFHGAKGREWHTVLLVGCETSLVPHRSATTNAARAEEARLLYVAITRATDELVVNWARRRGGYQRRLTPLLDEFRQRRPRSASRRPTELVAVRRTERDLALDRLIVLAGRHREGGRHPAPGGLPRHRAIDDRRPPTDQTRQTLDALTGLGVLTSRRLFPGIAAGAWLLLAVNS